MKNNVEIRDMEILLALERHQHFARAAQECAISQPAFSARIRNLEANLEVLIVRRGNRFLGFTEDGEIVLRWARKIMTDTEGLYQEIEIAKGALKGRLTVGVVPTALPYAARVAAQLRALHPKLAVEIRSLTSRQITLDVQDFSIDAGITYRDESDLSSLEFEAIYDEQYVLLAPSKLAPRKKGKASWQEAAEMPLCLLSKDMRNRRIIDDVFESIGAAAEPVMETNAFTAALAQVVSGSAATIAPRQLADSLFDKSAGVRLEMTSPEVSYSIGLITVAQETELPAIAALKDAIQATSQ